MACSSRCWPRYIVECICAAEDGRWQPLSVILHSATKVTFCGFKRPSVALLASVVPQNASGSNTLPHRQVFAGLADLGVASISHGSALTPGAASCCCACALVKVVTSGGSYLSILIAAWPHICHGSARRQNILILDYSSCEHIHPQLISLHPRILLTTIIGYWRMHCSMRKLRMRGSGRLRHL